MSDTPSTQPYLLRAIYDWAVDSGFTPHLLVNANAEGVRLPPGYVSDGRITLNVHPRAVRGLELGNEAISFSARFGGNSMNVLVPMTAVLAIFARENGQGLSFHAESATAVPEAPNQPESAEPEPPTEPSPPRGRPSLKRVK